MRKCGKVTNKIEKQDTANVLKNIKNLRESNIRNRKTSCHQTPKVMLQNA